MMQTCCTLTSDLLCRLTQCMGLSLLGVAWCRSVTSDETHMCLHCNPVKLRQVATWQTHVSEMSTDFHLETYGVGGLNNQAM